MIEGIPSPAINPLDPACARDPYPIFARLREHDPIYRDDAMGAWLVTSFDAFLSILQDPRFSLDVRDWAGFEPVTHPDLLRFSGIEAAMLFALPPVDHRRVRRLVSKAFTPRAVHALAPMIQSIVDDCLARSRSAGRLDLVSDFAASFPTRVISRLIGIPPNSAREHRFKQLAEVFIANVSPLLPLSEKIAAVPLLAEFYGLVDDCIAERRRAPQDDILSALIHAEEDGKRLSRDELLALVCALISAGSETTASSLVLGLRELLHTPDQLARFREEPELRANAVEELLRHQMPGFFTMRTPLEDITIADRAMRRGDLVLVGLAAAHRDPARFPDPDRVDIARDLSEVAVFGRGPHSCIGAQLARLELGIAYEALVDLPNLRLGCAYDEVVFAPHPTVRSVASLPLEFDPHSE